MTAEARANLVRGKQITKGVSLLEPLGAGGMGAVWLADHGGLKTRVVVKFMLTGLDTSESARIRFSREAAAAAQVKSPHVVQMLDHGVSDDGVPFIVMEHLEGHDLGDEIEKSGALEPGKVVAIVGQVAKALTKVHAAGFLHRDIKPDNIFLCAGEDDVFVKLLDFGIAKSSTLESEDGSLDGETKTGQVVGTPFYMSPEQVTAQKVIDHRSDLWSLGVVAYQALTGQRPYDGPSFGALAVKIATGSPPKPTEVNPALPVALDAWFAKACARSAADRFASAKEMAEGLRAALDGIAGVPSSRLGSDSGTRGAPGSTATPDPETPIGLAATALADEGGASLGRSEAGIAIAGGARASGRGSSLLVVGGAVVLTVAVAVVLVWNVRGSGSDRARPESPPSVASVNVPLPPASASAPAPSASVAVAPPMPSETPATVHDAGLATITPARPVAAPARPSGAAASASARPQASGSEVAPKPTPKPTSTEPDLF